VSNIKRHRRRIKTIRKVTEKNIIHWEVTSDAYIEEHDFNSWRKALPDEVRPDYLHLAYNCLNMAIKCRMSKIMDDHCQR